MDPISNAVTGYAADKATAVVESIFKRQVIERWTRYRAQKFFESFCASILDVGATDAEANEKLNILFSNEAHSEILFEAYRSVCLTKSRDTGPRVIAFLAAELILSNTYANEDDEVIFLAAEELNDFEFDEFTRYVKNAKNNKGGKFNPDGSLTIIVDSNQTTSGWPSTETSVGPVNLKYFGTWAPKLKKLGMLVDDVIERAWRYEADEERHIDEPGTAREIKWLLTIEKSAFKLLSLVDRAANEN